MTDDSITRGEQETTITLATAMPEVMVWTSRPRDLGEMRRRVASGLAREVRGGRNWGDFRIPAGSWSLKGFKRSLNLTYEQRAAMAESARQRFGHAPS